MRRVLEGHPFFVRELTAREFVALSEVAAVAADSTTSKQIEAMAKVCAIGVVDQSGATFNSDPEFWMDKPFNSIIKPLSEAVSNENGLREDDAPGK